MRPASRVLWPVVAADCDPLPAVESLGEGAMLGRSFWGAGSGWGAAPLCFCVHACCPVHTVKPSLVISCA
jgi:hypothetical protein